MVVRFLSWLISPVVNIKKPLKRYWTVIRYSFQPFLLGTNFDSSSTKIFKNALVQKSGSNKTSPASIATSKIDFSKPPYNKIDFLDSLQSAVGKTFPTPIELHQEFVGEVGTADIRSFLTDLCRTNEINVSASKSLSKLLDKLFGHFVEPSLVNPTFVFDHPLCMSPLAKEHRSKPGDYLNSKIASVYLSKHLKIR